MLKRFLSIFTLIFIFTSIVSANPFSGGSGQNPFAGKPGTDKNQAGKQKPENTKPESKKQETKADESGPGFFTRIWRWFVGVQRQLNQYLTKKIKSLKANFSFATFLVVLFISILYGFLHSIGPGHGKVVISSYFFKSEANIKDLMLLSGIISLIHNLSAGIISALLAFLTNINIISGQNTARGIAMLISGIILVGIGIYYFRDAFHHGHDHDEHNHDNDNEKHCETTPSKMKKMSLWAVGFSAGIVPCPLSIAVIFFGLYLNAITIVIISVIGMSIGMAFTEFLFGFASMKLRSGVLKIFKNKEKTAERVHFAFNITGAVVIILFGIFIGASFFV